ncbi:50S ribosomal protein L29 [Candidatus Berkelbacteria bacterium CG_4_8_14_3_um_filter_33_6]|uniref:Large ribosomal subunit protein uL29 n=1 Tax=Candidatus Berkelbacteria bacterium CG_4_10_14_0_2_um_filter_35_9_33_12 TaxID=1974499 RepID=A0A2M7W4P8_9BACT|nr:MAG: 50S ribosomal protein L29 [Candidatus Berkelbacteria bacterium CG23_combo_of_CG06-09_8_20_14_all_33_15]PIS08126.1 MAG: 50S ribosomal protein L29 [Candidatus Berkelbacteria bacterium CG10_big_fil_rev_8_21_14_0_10_33_10]PIX31282.1 MAG: 50S ribosomal protein L29 [Candidatus Berkelbacteria bacterium CG_4_8_14_3_um_filter_33_6]PIZ28436.1 MAG: 50S ribosomal protein L29 [Candidatus Berkelbacteria bacterium CG_4_10_14_0_8_um_filter_35_9_33_8]PJA20757.1 MAG: 50S ribosomal protein L29 [Candidatus
MKKTDILVKYHKMAIKSLLAEEDVLKMKLNSLRFSVNFGKTKNIHKINETKKNLARLKTILSKKLLSKIDEKN